MAWGCSACRPRRACKMAKNYRREALPKTPAQTTPKRKQTSRTCVWWFLLGSLVGVIVGNLYASRRAETPPPEAAAKPASEERPPAVQPRFKFQEILSDTRKRQQQTRRPSSRNRSPPRRSPNLPSRHPEPMSSRRAHSNARQTPSGSGPSWVCWASLPASRPPPCPTARPRIACAPVPMPINRPPSRFATNSSAMEKTASPIRSDEIGA